MIQYSQSTIDIANMFAEQHYGTTVLAAQENAKQAENKMKNMIMSCFTKLGMSINEIAELANEDPTKIRTILIAEKLIIP